MSRNGLVAAMSLLACLVSAQGIRTEERSHGRTPVYRLRETLRIGDTTAVGPDNILIQPRHVVRDKEGRVWIADQAVLLIKVFDRTGNCVATIGGRGRGPAEFQDVTAMTLNHRGELVVVDYLNAKFILFSAAGSFIATRPLPVTKVQWPRRISCTPDSGYILLAKLEEKDLLFHRFDKHFQYVRSFGELPVIDRDNRRFESRLAEAKPGEIAVNSQGILYHAPGLYDGRIYVYQNDRLRAVLRAETRVARPYEYEFMTTFRPGPPPPKYQITMGGPEGMYYARRNIISGGLNVLEDGTVTHLVVTFKGDRHEIGVELFSPDGSRVEYQKVAGDELPDYEWRASSGRWYLLDLQDIPRVVEFMLEREK